MGFFKSKKFSAFILGLITLVVTDLLGWDAATATNITAVIGSYLVGQGVADGFSKGATSNVAPREQVN